MDEHMQTLTHTPWLKHGDASRVSLSEAVLMAAIKGTLTATSRSGRRFKLSDGFIV